MKKNKILETFKNILIIFLIIFAVYQFFDMYASSSIGKISSWLDKDDKTFYFMPDQVMISFGDKEFVKIKEDSMQEELVSSYIEEIYDLIFRTKISFEEVDEDILSIMNNRSIILTYDSYNNFMLKELFDISNEKITRALSRIDNIIIIPGTSEGAKCIVYIYGNSKVLKFEISIDTTELYGLIDEINMFKTMNIYLLSENYDKYKNNFKSFVFIPAVIIENDVFDNDKEIEINSPFYENGIYSEELLEGYINTYFNNPNAKWKMEKDTQTLIYGDGERTITAYKEGFVTYSYTNISENVISLYEAINIAKERLDKDIYLSKYVKLSDVKKVNNYTYELYYDYYINDHKVEISNAIKNKYILSYPLQVTIRGNDISTIKGIILSFKEPEEITDDDIKQDNKEILTNINAYDNVLNDFISQYPEAMINDFKIDYFKNSMTGKSNMLWIIQTDKEYFTYDVYK